MVDWGWTERDCLRYCYERGYDWDGLYEHFKRVSCWCCPLQSLTELRELHQHFPELWEQLKTWDKRTWRNFRADYSVEDLEVRFLLEREWTAAGKSTVARFGFNGGTFECLFSGAAVNRLGSSVYYWDTGYIEKLYLSSNCYLTASAGKLCVNGTAIGGSDTTTSFAGKELKMGGSTSYYIIASTARELKPSASGTTYPFYLGTSSLYWHYAYLGSNTAKIGSSASSKIGFFAGSPIARQTLSTYSQNMSYSAATSSNYLKILNNLVGILVKYGLIGT